MSDYDKELLLLGSCPKIPLYDAHDKDVIKDDENILKVDETNKSEFEKTSRPISSLLKSDFAINSEKLIIIYLKIRNFRKNIKEGSLFPNYMTNKDDLKFSIEKINILQSQDLDSDIIKCKN